MQGISNPCRTLGRIGKRSIVFFLCTSLLVRLLATDVACDVFVMRARSKDFQQTSELVEEWLHLLRVHTAGKQTSFAAAK